ncbi:LTA synthase family protein [Halomonas sp. DP8Y7-3]|uniref:LTA synthase family protein n=1 Tax=Halomonas sp. DP8Y7-3 TaxID=2859079 RepID=UPI001C9644E0|nr:LTA synthase family protein [Halomonas sp. DP8Y7-3]MBY5928650.1 LTA synthase family protein [Halomonas sp. DP8Y7-3]
MMTSGLDTQIARTALCLGLLGLPLGTLLSLALEASDERAPWRQRPASAWLVHMGSWGLVYLLWLALVQRGMLAMVITLTLQWVVHRSHQAKWQSLKEPFLLQDFEYFLDAVRHPRLYLPFFGITLAISATLAGLLAIAAFWWLEPSLMSMLGPQQSVLWWLFLALAPSAALALGLSRLPGASLDPVAHHRRLGLWAGFWAFARYPDTPIDVSRAPISLRQPRRMHFNQPSIPLSQHTPPFRPSVDNLPHLVIVQGESLFDPRPWYSQVPAEVLSHWDHLCASALAHGRLSVPAWGANTVRSETAFLCGLSADALGMHRFNPYHQLARQQVPSLASACSQLGYRTLVLHPYPASFYQRDKVMPRLGFDVFEDLDSFRHERRDGPYVADAVLAERVERALQDPDPRPLMVLVITMESHGPFLLEPMPSPLRWLTPDSRRPDKVSHELDIYLHHLANIDAMIGHLAEALTGQSRPGLLCAYGDHVPILSASYEWLGDPDGRTPFLLWSPQGASIDPQPPVTELTELADGVLDAASALAYQDAERRSSASPHFSHGISPNVSGRVRRQKESP